MGQIIKSGTGLCDILLDEEKLMENMESLSFKDEYEIIDESNINDLLQNEIDEEQNEICDESDFKFSFE